MKKTISILAISALFVISCNKSNKTVSTATNPQGIHLTEMNAGQISQLITPKQNDTIYVTNFFATWCGPCMHEIPYFKEKMDEMKNEKVKFTFISVDSPEDWATEVNEFAVESGLSNQIVLFNNQNITEDFFSKNFQDWDGSAIPFTLITKGNYRDEHIGMMSKEALSEKINALKK